VPQELVQSYTVSVKVNGAEEKDFLDDLIEIVVDQALFMPGMFTIQIQDRNLSLSSTFTLGATVTLGIGMGDDTATTLIDGIVTGLEYSLATDGSYLLTVRGYDSSYKLTQGQTLRAFANATDKDIILKVASDAGLTATVDSTSDTYQTYILFGQTDWEFILSRAYRLGYLVRTEGTKLYVQNPASLGSVELKLGETLLQFEPRVSILGQLTETTVLGWDVTNKTAITGSASSSKNSPFHTLNQTGQAAMQSAKGDTKTYVVDQMPLISTGQATTMATSLLNTAESQYLRAEGMCYGNLALQIGKVAQVREVGDKFSKDYLVTHVRHVFTAGGYTTHFSASGAAIDALPYLLNPYNPARQPRIDGVVIGLVTNNKDEEGNLGRVKLKYPWLPKVDGAEIESGWARIALPGGGAQRGLFFLPEVNDEVLVSFEFGDINCPMVIGGMYNGQDAHPLSSDAVGSDGKVNERVLKTRSGHIITFGDKDGEEKISIIDKTTKNSIVFDSAANSITLKADGDIVMEAGGKLTMKATSDFSVEGSKGSIKSTQGTMDVNATGALTMKTNAKASLEGTGGAEVKGATVDVVAQASASLKGNAMVTVQGGLVKIN
jgi:uncharacterized protein involved in type VI secretion and phage assembly